MPKIIQALPSTRWSIKILAFTLFLSLLYFHFFLTGYIEQIKHLAQVDPARAFDKFFPIYSVFFLFAASTLVFLGLYLLRFGGQVLKYGEFPPPGTTVIVDTIVIEGDAARAKAALSLNCAFLFLFAGLTLPYFAFELIHQLARYMH